MHMQPPTAHANARAQLAALVEAAALGEAGRVDADDGADVLLLLCTL